MCCCVFWTQIDLKEKKSTNHVADNVMESSDEEEHAGRDLSSMGILHSKMAPSEAHKHNAHKQCLDSEASSEIASNPDASCASSPIYGNQLRCPLWLDCPCPKSICFLILFYLYPLSVTLISGLTVFV